MISRISGTVVSKKDGMILLDVGNLSYAVLVPGAIMKALNETPLDSRIDLVTYHYYQMEPSRAVPVLIGFNNEVEREFFEKFISVSGVGPRAACRALAEPFSAIAGAIDSGDTAFLKRLPGIGEQRARLIIAKLQGKVGKYGLIKDKEFGATDTSYADIKKEALEILLQLQYRQNEAENMINKALERSPSLETSEDLLNEVYKERSVVR
ncbi:MAG: Holliday junction branch migration protein RuvA [Candidatus Omnitrophota bacterium]